MGRRIFTSKSSRRKMLSIEDRIEDSDKILLDCKKCKIKTPHIYERSDTKPTNKTEYYYRCHKCNEVYVSDVRF